jgi:hypothetical protein
MTGHPPHREEPMAKRKPVSRITRSKKAGKPPEAAAVAPRVRRRMKTARAAFTKGTDVHQAAEGPRVAWAAGKRRLKKG